MNTKYIEREHAFCKKNGGRLRPEEVDDDTRVLPRNMRRKLARRLGYVRVPVAILSTEIDAICRDLQGELDKRAARRLVL